MWPHERSLVKQLADKPFAVIGVNLSEPNTSALKKLAEKENLTWRSFSDPPTSEGGGAIAKKWNLAGTPTIYLIDHKGVIRHKWLGGTREKVIDEALEKLIKEAEGEGKKDSK
jgi:peroxiredoxin